MWNVCKGIPWPQIQKMYRSPECDPITYIQSSTSCCNPLPLILVHHCARFILLEQYYFMCNGGIDTIEIQHINWIAIIMHLLWKINLIKYHIRSLQNLTSNLVFNLPSLLIAIMCNLSVLLNIHVLVHYSLFW